MFMFLLRLNMTQVSAAKYVAKKLSIELRAAVDR